MQQSQFISVALMQQALEDLIRGDAGSVLLYFAGHRKIDSQDGSGYLVCHDADFEGGGIALLDITDCGK